MNAPMRQLYPVAIICIVFLAVVWPLILSGRIGTSEATDEERYHLPIIEQFARQLPAPDLVDYPSATAPGYHLVMAVVYRLGGEHPTALRLVNSLLGLGLILVVFRYTAGLVDPWHGLLLTAPLALCAHVISGAAWLTTDNAAMLFVGLAVGGCAMGPVKPRRLLLAQVWTACAVAVRQIQLWPMGVAVAAALLRRRKRRGAVLAAALFGAALPLGLVVWMYLGWDGLTPPKYRDLHDAGLNPATPAFALALLGALGGPWLTAIGPGLRGLIVNRLSWVAAAFALLASLSPATSYDKAAGRWGGWLWLAVRETPVMLDRSLLLGGLAVIGAVTLGVALVRAVNRGRGGEAFTLLIAMVGAIAAQTVNSQCFQRYLEVTLLMLFAWIVALGGLEHRRRGWWIGPAIVVLLQLGLLLISVIMPVVRGETVGSFT